MEIKKFELELVVTSLNYRIKGLVDNLEKDPDNIYLLEEYIKLYHKYVLEYRKAYKE